MATPGAEPKQEAAQPLPSPTLSFHQARRRLLRQAMELSVHYDCEVGLVLFDRDGRLTQFSSASMERVLRRYSAECGRPHESHTAAALYRAAAARAAEREARGGARAPGSGEPAPKRHRLAVVGSSGAAAAAAEPDAGEMSDPDPADGEDVADAIAAMRGSLEPPSTAGSLEPPSPEGAAGGGGGAPPAAGGDAAAAAAAAAADAAAADEAVVIEAAIAAAAAELAAASAAAAGAEPGALAGAAAVGTPAAAPALPCAPSADAPPGVGVSPGGGAPPLDADAEGGTPPAAAAAAAADVRASGRAKRASRKVASLPLAAATE